jgi:hypothetical protein
MVFETILFTTVAESAAQVFSVVGLSKGAEIEIGEDIILKVVLSVAEFDVMLIVASETSELSLVIEPFKLGVARVMAPVSVPTVWLIVFSVVCSGVFDTVVFGSVTAGRVGIVAGGVTDDRVVFGSVIAGRVGIVSGVVTAGAVTAGGVTAGGVTAGGVTVGRVDVVGDMLIPPILEGLTLLFSKADAREK